MHIIIDSNEYIFSFGLEKRSTARLFLDKLIDNITRHTLSIPRTIIEEVKRNLTIEAFKEFAILINSIAKIDEDTVVPFETVFEYEAKGLKPTDAFIAAYVEYKNAEVLVTENRHFLSRQKSLPFKVLTAEKAFILL